MNSLDFPVQLIIHSRRLNIAPYLDSLLERHRDEENKLLKIQIAEYAEFIKTFTESSNIMSKTFYAVIPFTPSVYEQGGIMGSLLSTLGLAKGKKNQSSSFEEYKNQLWQRVETVVAGLQGFGVRSVPLNTEELIELFYGLYNPTEFEHVSGPSGSQ